MGIKLAISFFHIHWFSFHFSTGQLPLKSHYLVDLQNFDLDWTAKRTITMVQRWILTNWTLSRHRSGLAKHGGEPIYMLHLTPSRLLLTPTSILQVPLCGQPDTGDLLPYHSFTGFINLLLVGNPSFHVVHDCGQEMYRVLATLRPLARHLSDTWSYHHSLAKGEALPLPSLVHNIRMPTPWCIHALHLSAFVSSHS